MAEHNPRSMTELGLHFLVLRCQTGDERAFRQLMEQFGERTLRYLQGLVGDAAEDVQQEVWLAVYRGIATLANPGAFRTWLFRATRHRALDQLRRWKREKELIADVSLDELEPIVASPEHEDDRLDESLVEALDGLSPAHREVCLLRYRDGMSYTEIAVIVGSTVGTVRSRLHYAKRTLNEIINRRRNPTQLAPSGVNHGEPQ